MPIKLACATLAIVSAMAPASAFAQSAEITIWSWDSAALALQSTIAGFNAQHPDIKVIVEDLGNQQVFDKLLAGCAAGGAGLPDIVTVENGEAEIFWNQFPDCFVDQTTIGYTAETAALFPDFKLTELKVGDKVYSMPWDSGPVAVFYRRDFYEKAGVDPASITTWDDFIAAGQKIQEANPGVTMTQADFNGGSEFFQMMANEQGCAYFNQDGTEVAIAGDGCVAALGKLKEIKDAGIITAADWGGKLQANGAGTVATQMFGGWYEGSLRNSATDSAGQWGVYMMPSLTADGPRAANLGGSSLAITSATDNAEAAYAYLSYALGSVEGQITMLREHGIVPSLTAALQDPFVSEPQAYWGDQAIWSDILATLPKIKPIRGTAFFADADAIFRQVQTKYLDNGYATADEALADAASQIASVTGLPVAQ